MNNIEAFNMDNDIGAPLIEGFADHPDNGSGNSGGNMGESSGSMNENSNCSNKLKGACNPNNDQSDPCMWNGTENKCVDNTMGGNSGTDTNPSCDTYQTVEDCNNTAGRCMIKDGVCVDKQNSSDGNSMNGFNDYNPEMNNDSQNDEPDSNADQDTMENFYGDYENEVSNNVNNASSSGSIVNVDLLLKSLVYGCVFYILAHPETMAVVRKLFKKISNDNLLLVHMVVFVVVYYVFSLFI